MKRLWVRFVLSYLAVVLVAVLVSSLCVHRQLRSHFLKGLENDLYRSARMIGVMLPSEWPATGSSGENQDDLCRKLKAQSGYRCTLVSREGKVLGDSDEASAGMENHLYRPEIRAALEQGQGSSIRFSHTLKETMLYAAVLSPIGPEPVILRLSIPARQVEVDLSAIRSSLLVWSSVGFALTLPLLYLFSRTMSRRIVRLKHFLEAVRRGERSRRLYVGSRDELGELERELDEVAEELSRYVDDLTVERRRRGVILEAIEDGIVLLDDEDRVLFINPAAARIFHVARDSSRGQRLLEVIRSEDLYALVRKARRDVGPTEAGEVVLLTDPDLTFLVTAVAPAEREGSGSIGCLLLLRDISEAKRLDRIRADFVSHVSHELRTPLTLIKGFVETLRDEGVRDPEKAQRYLSIIGENTDRLVRLVEDLLRLSSIELGRIPLRRQPVRIEEIVERASRTLEPRFREKGLALIQSFEEGLPPVAGDPDRLVEILLNLLDNAVKYTQSGEIRVTAEVRPPSTGQAGPQVALSVSDTGIGIPARELPRVTERFYRGERGNQKDVRGSGLGLAIVKHLAKAMDGRVLISSKENAGTTVTVVLPAWSECEEGVL